MDARRRHVSRETSPPAPPAVASALCGDALGAVTTYAELLAGPGVAHGLIGPREIPRLWERHLLNCAVVVPTVPTGASVIDVGSGAGLPGLVWALLRSDLQVVLVEPLLRRAEFLRGAVQELGLTGVRVERARAEELQGRCIAEVVTARAVAPLPRLLDWTLPLVQPGGRLLAFKGRTAGAELAAASDTLCTAETSAVLTTYGENVLDPPTTIVEVSAPPVPPPG